MRQSEQVRALYDDHKASRFEDGDGFTTALKCIYRAIDSVEEMVDFRQTMLDLGLFHASDAGFNIRLFFKDLPRCSVCSRILDILTQSHVKHRCNECVPSCLANAPFDKDTMLELYPITSIGSHDI